MNDYESDPSYKYAEIELLLASIRIATGFSTGYAQVIINNIYQNTECESVFGPSQLNIAVRKYPLEFDHYGWLKNIPIVNVKQIEVVASIYKELSQIETNDPISFAVRRLNDCYLRHRIDDAFLDVMIALETLLSDEETAELTHKLALRLASLLKIINFNGEERLRAFRTLKNLYSYRSKIVHGKANEINKNVKNKFDSDERKPLSEAIKYLNHVITIQIHNKKCRTTSYIDTELLLGCQLSK